VSTSNPTMYLIEWETENGSVQGSYVLDHALTKGALTFTKADSGARSLGSRTIRGVTWVEVRDSGASGK